MYVAYTAEQEALRQELRGYFAELMAPEVEAECGELPSRSCSRQRLRLGPQRRPGRRALPPSCPDLQHRSPTMQLLQPAFNHVFAGDVPHAGPAYVAHFAPAVLRSAAR